MDVIRVLNISKHSYNKYATKVNECQV